MSTFDLQCREVGDDCIEVAFVGAAKSSASERLEAAFTTALGARRHVLLSFAACDDLDPEIVAAIEAGRERLWDQGLDVLSFGASGVVGELLASTPPAPASDAN